MIRINSIWGSKPPGRIQEFFPGGGAEFQLEITVFLHTYHPYPIALIYILLAQEVSCFYKVSKRSTRTWEVRFLYSYKILAEVPGVAPAKTNFDFWKKNLWILSYYTTKGFPKKKFSTFGPAVYRQIHIHERRALLSRRLAEVPSVARGIF